PHPPAGGCAGPPARQVSPPRPGENSPPKPGRPGRDRDRTGLTATDVMEERCTPGPAFSPDSTKTDTKGHPFLLTVPRKRAMIKANHLPGPHRAVYGRLGGYEDERIYLYHPGKSRHPCPPGGASGQGSQEVPEHRHHRQG